MDWGNIISGVVALVGIAGTVLGILGKQRYQRIIEAVIHGVEAAGHKETKAQIATAASLNDVDAHLDNEIKRVTGKPVKRQRHR